VIWPNEAQIFISIGQRQRWWKSPGKWQQK